MNQENYSNLIKEIYLSLNSPNSVKIAFDLVRRFSADQGLDIPESLLDANMLLDASKEKISSHLAGDGTTADLILDLLIHCQRVVKLHDESNLVLQQETIIQETANAMDFGIAFITEEGEVTFSNNALMKLEGKVLDLKKGGIRFRDANINRHYRAALKKLVRNRTTAGTRLLELVTPATYVSLSDLVIGLFNWRDIGEQQELQIQDSLIVFTFSFNHMPQVNINRFFDLFQFKALEKDIARLILDGRAIKQVASELEMAESTIKNNLRSLYKKSKTRRSAELFSTLVHTSLGELDKDTRL